MHVEDLRTPVAACSDEATIVAEAYAADNTRVREGVHKVNVQFALNARVEHGVPIITSVLEMWRKLVWLELGQCITDAFNLCVRVLEVCCDVRRWWRRCWAIHVRRAGIRVDLTLLWCRRTSRSASADPWFGSGRSCRLWLLCSISCITS